MTEKNLRSLIGTLVKSARKLRLGRGASRRSLVKEVPKCVQHKYSFGGHSLLRFFFP